MPHEDGVNIINGSVTNTPTDSRSTSPTPVQRRERRFQNGWSGEQERLMSEWCDISLCYRWLHDRSDKIYHNKTLYITLPVLILSTIGGFSNIGIQAVLHSEEMKTYASFAIGSVSLIAGLLTAIGDRLRYPQLEESHRVSAIAWGKFQRLIAVELALNPNDRMDSLDFLKICRSELDRLIEQSPSIPKEAIQLFEEKFGHIKDLKKPDICGSLEHTRIFSNSQDRLKQLAVEAALMLRRKKQTLNELVTPAIEQTIRNQIEQRLGEALDERKKYIEEELNTKRRYEEREREDRDKALDERRRKIEKEIELEKTMIYKEHSRSASDSQFESRMKYKRNLNDISSEISKSESSNSIRINIEESSR